jgi:hypothetical protein
MIDPAMRARAMVLLEVFMILLSEGAMPVGSHKARFYTCRIAMSGKPPSLALA